MERREQYDPEDIESLLTERSFDELLAEERAFVLRHLSGRDEYEQMRALLHYVRPDERSRPTIEPEDRVRTNVIAAFRAQQQPQWRVWLNSIAVWLVPREAFAIWRPALAFASLALLIVAGVVAVRQFGAETGSAQLAEVKEVNGLQEEKAATEQTVRSETMDTVFPIRTAKEPSASVGETSNTSVAQASSATEPPTAMLDLEVAETKFMEQVEDASSDAVTDDQVREDLAAAERNEKDMVSAPATTGATSTAAAPTLSHVVTQDELVRNQSMANVSEVSKATKARKRSVDMEKAPDVTVSSSRSLGQDPALLGLINSGW